MNAQSSARKKKGPTEELRDDEKSDRASWFGLEGVPGSETRQ